MQVTTIRFILYTLCASFVVPVFSQQVDMAKLLEDELAKQPKKTNYTYATFKGTRLVNAHSIETIRKHELDFRVAHRFGDIIGEYGGNKTFFGLENSTDIKISFDYGISDRLTVGIGRVKGGLLL